MFQISMGTSLETGPGSSNISAASSASLQPFPEVKRRKRHRRMHVENQEPCIMRGVYFKNLKWQAAIKADNKQIHLGTVGSQEEAARLYDSGFILAEVKRRKRHRRKHVENQEPCIMRGVYFKNLKWQATIKVDKKQIHLGTVGSQEEAARLYDRATFMCGRDPNFELSEEEKQELRKFNWDEFLAITNKKNQRHGGTGPRRMLLDND